MSDVWEQCTEQVLMYMQLGILVVGWFRISPVIGMQTILEGRWEPSRVAMPIVRVSFSLSVHVRMNIVADVFVRHKLFLFLRSHLQVVRSPAQAHGFTCAHAPFDL